MKSRVWCVSCFLLISPKNTTRNNGEVITQVITRTAAVRRCGRLTAKAKSFFAPAPALRWLDTPMIPRALRFRSRIPENLKGGQPPKYAQLFEVPIFLRMRFQFRLFHRCEFAPWVFRG